MGQPAGEDTAHAPRRQDLMQATQQARRLASASSALVNGTHGSRTLSTDAAFECFAAVLAGQGIRPALIYLVGLSDYRFIGIFRFRDGKATSAVHVDRADLSVLQAAEVPDSATYCCIVRDRSGAFVTVEAMLDPRVSDHPARDAVPAYCGLPILTPEGGLIGTLCHYDLVPRDPQRLDLELLVRVSSALARPGLVPPYPD